MVPDHVWKFYVPKDLRHRILCFGCWRALVRRTDTGFYAAHHASDDDDRRQGGLMYPAYGVLWVFGPPEPHRMGIKDRRT